MLGAEIGKTVWLGALGVVLVVAGALGVPSTAGAGPNDSAESCSDAEAGCPEPAPGDTGTGLAPTPHGAVPIAVNVAAVVATLVAILGIVTGLRTRYRP